ncbi:FMN-dependent NADH-azoreductase [Paenibacillus jamilae]|uniref:FMN-dependent NADH-azoreductase n=1 Tax=Paenibacillus jamilae TaxID=114136 RepID=A0ACC4ZR62_9BACL|nr:MULTISPECIES: NAD(P)H-dependent oxidoreductase [Paenibacillus]AUO08804.1 FMN-dependent NADH-azoreductase [Paenibacillus sp. lzh-N1]KTS80728.1 FMN-dependent NADH-azoreductase [Paenibacillus jamilae]
MATVLYITAHPFKDGTYSLSVGKQFIEAYQEANPGDEVIHLDLYCMDLPQIDADLLRRWGQPLSGPSFDELSEESRIKAERMCEIVDQFMVADKIVIVNPVWNLSFPSVLKTYIDAVTVTGKTIKRSENGLRGLSGLTGTQQGKKVMHIQASGTVLSHGKFKDVEYCHSYIKAIMNLLGIDDVQAIFVEGISEQPDQAQSIKEQAIRQAILAAQEF